MDNFKHQTAEFDRHRADAARALLWQPRTGKTKSTIDVACHLFGAMEIRGVLVIAPNGIHRQWIDEQVLLHGWPEYETNRFAWRLSQSNNQGKFNLWSLTIKYDEKRMHWLSVNMESLRYVQTQRAISFFIAQLGGRVLAVFDESHHFSRPGTKRTAVARGIARKVSHRRILTGTESEESPLQSFSQYELLDRAALGCQTYGEFKNKYATYEMSYGARQYPILTGYKNLEELKDKKAKYSSVVLRSDCSDLPRLMVMNRYVEMTQDQAKLWRDVKKNEIETLEALGQTSALVGGAALVKLQQIEGGYWIGEDKSLKNLCGPWTENPKIAALMEEIRSTDGPIIVWHQFIHEIAATRAAIEEELKIKVAQYHGKWKKREEDLVAFREGRLRVLLGQPVAGGEGRQMPAQLIIWFSHTASARIATQASERATVMGGRSVQVVRFMARGGVDEYHIDICERKTELAEDMSRSGLVDTLRRLNI